jgi:hypothetical protein
MSKSAQQLGTNLPAYAHGSGLSAFVRMMNNALSAIAIGVAGYLHSSDLECYLLSGLGLALLSVQLQRRFQDVHKEKRLRLHLDYMYDDWKIPFPRMYM